MSIPDDGICTFNVPVRTLGAGMDDGEIGYGFVSQWIAATGGHRMDALISPVGVLAAVAAVDFNLSYMLGNLASSLLVAVLTWIVAAKVTLAKHAEALKQQVKLTEKLIDKVDGQQAEINAFREARIACELRAGKTFSARGEHAELAVAVASSQRAIADKLDHVADSFRNAVGKTHGRIDQIQDRVTRVEERVAAGSV